MRARAAARCIHGRTDCPRCAAFSAFLVVAVADRDAAWRPGILAHLNAQSDLLPRVASR